jgi:hypothetical protein
MTRTAQGTGTSPYYLDNEGASQRASNEARQTLAHRLNRDVDTVWCPKCQRLQEHMFAKARMQKFGSWYWLAGITAVVALGCCWVSDWSALGVFIFAAAAAMLGSVLIRSRLFDPNAAVELRKRKNGIHQNKLMLRSEYETALEAARQKGVARSNLLRLTWPRGGENLRRHKTPRAAEGSA